MPYHWLDFTPPRPQIAAAPVANYSTAAHIGLYTGLSRPFEGCLYSIFRCGAGSGGRSGASEMRRKLPSPAVQAAHVPAHPSVRHWAPLAVAAGMVRNAGFHLGPIAVDRRPANPKGEARSPETVSPPGAERSKPINIARGTPGEGRTCVATCFDKPRCREASRRVGPLRTLAFRAPSYF